MTEWKSEAMASLCLGGMSKEKFLIYMRTRFAPPSPIHVRAVSPVRTQSQRQKLRFASFRRWRRMVLPKRKALAWWVRQESKNNLQSNHPWNAPSNSIICTLLCWSNPRSSISFCTLRTKLRSSSSRMSIVGVIRSIRVGRMSSGERIGCSREFERFWDRTGAT